MSPSTLPAKVKWLVRIDPGHVCRHVNLVTERATGVPDEQEYLFAPILRFHGAQGYVACGHGR